MQVFDCLSLDCPLFGPHLLEASAGTGKTFSIEHIVVRLLLEGVDIERILCVTFTKAATRELKARIRSNIAKALCALQDRQVCWPYLGPHIGQFDSIRRLSDALCSFDLCPIFTIHGFCFRFLRDFAFDANMNVFIDLEQRAQSSQVLKQAARDFLENGISEDLLCLEQLSLLMKKFDSMEKLIKELINMKPSGNPLGFSQTYEACKAALQCWNIEEALLIEDFECLARNYKSIW